MFNFGARSEWRDGRIVVSSYLDVETTEDKCRLLNHTPLDFIASYIMEDDVSAGYLNRLPHIRLNFIDGYIQSYCYIIYSLERLEYIRQANKLDSIHCDLESECMREKKEKKKGVTEAG